MQNRPARITQGGAVINSGIRRLLRHRLDASTRGEVDVNVRSSAPRGAWSAAAEQEEPHEGEDGKNGDNGNESR